MTKTVRAWTQYHVHRVTCVQHDFHDAHCACHENRAGHKYPSIVLLLHDTHTVCHENRAGHKYPMPSCYCYTTRTLCVCVMKMDETGHKYPSIVLLLHDTHSVCHENRAGHKYPIHRILVTVTRHAQCVFMKIVLDTSIRLSCYCYDTHSVS